MVGTSGAGKSTLAAGLARVLDAEFLELDSVFHQPGWVPLAVILLAWLVAMVAGLYPALRASRLNIARALRAD